MSQPPIDKGVPLPRRYPFADMQVGDSFLVPEGVKRSNVSVAAKRYGDRHGAAFTVRKVPEGLRCWRIA